MTAEMDRSVMLEEYSKHELDLNRGTKLIEKTKARNLLLCNVCSVLVQVPDYDHMNSNLMKSL